MENRAVMVERLVLELGAVVHTASNHTESVCVCVCACAGGGFAYSSSAGLPPSLVCSKSINPLEIHKHVHTWQSLVLPCDFSFIVASGVVYLFESGICGEIASHSASVYLVPLNSELGWALWVLQVCCVCSASPAKARCPLLRYALSPQMPVQRMKGNQLGCGWQR